MLKGAQRSSFRLYKNFADEGLRPRVLMAYEDLNVALRAMNVLALIAKETGDSLDIQFSMWRFDFFNAPDMLEAAVRQAEQADIIVFAPKNSGGLSAPVTLWLEQWTGRRQSLPGTLVAVFDPATEPHLATSAVVSQLHAVAGLTGMDFFFSGSDNSIPPALAERIRPRATESPRFDAGPLVKEHFRMRQDEMKSKDYPAGDDAPNAPELNDSLITGASQPAGANETSQSAGYFHSVLLNSTPEWQCARLDLSVCQILEHMDDAVIAHDSGVIVALNQRAAELLGCPEEKLLWRRLSKFIDLVSIPTLTRWIEASDQYSILVNGVRAEGGFLLLRLEAIASLLFPGGRRVEVISLVEFDPAVRSGQARESDLAPRTNQHRSGGGRHAGI